MFFLDLVIKIAISFIPDVYVLIGLIVERKNIIADKQFALVDLVGPVQVLVDWRFPQVLLESHPVYPQQNGNPRVPTVPISTPPRPQSLKDS